MADSPSILKEMDNLAANISIGADGLTVIPHFSGKACPEFNSEAKGVFLGVSLLHMSLYLDILTYRRANIMGTTKKIKLTDIVTEFVLEVLM